jgi:RimJ/RimL family protein N-acetyltransferase
VSGPPWLRPRDAGREDGPLRLACAAVDRLADAETERLWLRRWSAAQHTYALADVNRDPRVMRYMGGPLSEAETAAASERYEDHWDAHGFGLWAAMEKASGHMLGFIGLCHPLWHPELSGEVEVGWRLRRAVWGRGLATEGGRAALRAGFDELGLEEVISVVDPDNAASVAVTRKLGMTLRDSGAHPQSGLPIEVMSIRRPDTGEPAGLSSRPEAARGH